MPQTIVLLRHARAIKNEQNQHGGSGTPLSDGVTEDINIIARQLSCIIPKIETILYSPRKQCEQTAEILKEQLHIKIKELQELEPINLGIADGLSEQEVINNFPEIGVQLSKWRNGEIEINQLKISGMTDCYSWYVQGEAFIEKLIESKESYIIVASRSILVLLFNLLLGRTPQIGGNYREVKWGNLEYAVFTNNGISQNFHLSTSSLKNVLEEQLCTIRGTLGNLRGVIHKSVYPPKGIALLVHGYFTSNKQGPENLYVQIARIFANFGYEFWRFDSYGTGDSDGHFYQSSYKLRLIDYNIILEYALKQHTNIIILGHSAGTNIAVRLANMYPTNIQTLFFLSPSFGNISYIDNLISKDTQTLLFKHRFAQRRTQIIQYDFIEQISSEEIYTEVSMCSAKFILFYGLNDEYYDEYSINHLIKHTKNFVLVKIPKCGHNFLNERDVLFEKLNFEILKH